VHLVCKEPTSTIPHGSLLVTRLTDRVKVLRPTGHKIGHLGDVLTCKSPGEVLKN